MPSSTPKQQQNRRIVLAQRPPEGPLDTTSVFREETVPLDLPTESGDILVRISYVSLDPAMRGWLRDARSYIPPVQIGAVMRASGIGRVVASRDPAIKVGTQVLGTFGWQEYWLGKGKHVEVLPPPPPGAKSLDYLGPLGMTGMTAYFGIFDVGQIKDGETVVITGAAGAVGAVVTQIALLFPKCKVIAIAGSKEKLENLKKMGCHEVINYKDKDWKEQFKTKVGYLDVYFDNVGGEMLDFALKRLNPHARIVMCGAISDYNNATPYRLGNYQALISQKARMEGYIVFDYAARYNEGRSYLANQIKAGKLESRFHVVQGGLSACPEALQGLFQGVNDGKMVVKVWDDNTTVPRENKL